MRWWARRIKQVFGKMGGVRWQIHCRSPIVAENVCDGRCGASQAGCNNDDKKCGKRDGERNWCGEHWKVLAAGVVGMLNKERGGGAREKESLPLTAPAPLLAIRIFWMALVPPVNSTYSCTAPHGGKWVSARRLAARRCSERNQDEWWSELN